MRLIFHGELEKLFGSFVDMASETVADAIEGFSRQMREWPRDLRLAVLTDLERIDTVEKLFDHHDVIHLMPSMAGGSGKFTNIILGAAMIGLSFALPGLGVAISAGLHSALIVSGALMIAQGVIGMFMKAPKINSVSDPEASKYLQVNKNTTDVGTAITAAWGRINLAGQWISIQSDSSNLSYGTFPTNPT